MREGPPKFIPKVEQQETIDSPEKQLESARVFGEHYSEVIDAALGKRDMKSFEQEKLDPQLQLLVQHAQIFKAEQQQRQTEAQLDAQGMLSQVFKTEEQQKLLQDTSKYRMEELSPGVYGIFVNPQLASKLRPGAAAMAVSLKNGISFLFIQDHTETEFRQQYLEENLPHETHHLVWGAAQRLDAFPNKETDPDYKQSFTLFQDELLARASTSGALGGYTHINSLSPDARAELESRSPGKAQAIIERVSSLNEFLMELNGLLARSEKVSKKDLVQTIMKAKTFDELERGLHEMKALVEKFPLKELEQNDGWGSFTT
ncbi:hypothetical protein K8Q93_01155 [Candidatus Parcubacteria bacterium]|nr:hypothetical protein [Candidatus Parcubacteria bacterium]